MARKKSLVAVVFSTHNKAYLTLSHQLYKRKRKSFSWTHRWVLSWKWYTQPRAFKIQVSVQCNPLQETSSTKDFVVSLQEVVVRTFLLRYTHTFAATGRKSHLPGRTKVTRGFYISHAPSQIDTVSLVTSQAHRCFFLSCLVKHRIRLCKWPLL